jgi:hypothetical protein
MVRDLRARSHATMHIGAGAIVAVARPAAARHAIIAAQLGRQGNANGW